MRIYPEVAEQAKIAATLKGVTMQDYVRDVLMAATTRDIEEFRRGGAPPVAKARKSRTN